MKSRDYVGRVSFFEGVFLCDLLFGLRNFVNG